MQAVTRWVLGSIWQSILLSVVCYLVPYCVLFAVVIMLFITLRQGITKGLVVGLSSAIIGVLARFLLGGIFAELDVNLLGQSLYWALLMTVPVWAFTVMLRQTVSLNYTTQMMTLCAMGLFAICSVGQLSLFPTALKAPINEYVNNLTTSLIEAQASTPNVSTTSEASQTSINPSNREQINQFLVHLFEIVTLYTTYLSLLILARAWQSYMFMPKEFSKEFQAVRSGSLIVAIIVGTWLLGIVSTNDSVLYSSAGVLFIGFIWLFIAGIAFMHWLMQEYKMSWRALVLFYSSLVVPIISSFMFLLLVLVGLTDGFINLRNAVLRRQGPKELL